MDNSYKTIQFEKKEQAAVLTLDRPQKLNAFNLRMLEEMLDAIKYVNANDDIEFLIITGSGKAFCAGADLSSGKKTFDKNFDTRDFHDAEYRKDAGGILNLELYRCLKPVIIACNGDAVGVGATMQLPADIRIASSNARYGFVFANRGIVPDGCASWFLPRVIGISKSLQLCYSGKLIDAEEALDIGLIDYICDDNVVEYALDKGRALCSSSAPVSIAMTRQMIWSLSGESNPELAHEIESKAIDSRGQSDDAKEGVMSFLEKRKPKFKNKVSSDMPEVYPWENK
ncbi:MAG: enoyl-CoA hydratase-related protein [Gammaproteobacteria bacterium]